MVHNSFTEQYECADAYFALLDDGVLSDCSPIGDDFAAMTEYQLDRYEHWRVSCTDDQTALAWLRPVRVVELVGVTR
ncbi:hypothetical protein CO540_13230 [Micromonospora sp. WMMA2032]|nr:hypothetical protein CO540_13230 [Micromonospora sp. WMMA2032]